MNNTSRNNKYFAIASTEEIGHELKTKVDQYYNFMNGSGIFRRQYRSTLHYYGVSPTSNATTDTIRAGGKHGQISLLKVNHFRNLGQHLIQLTTSQRPSPQPIATNSDAKSQQQAILAKGILDYYSREKRLDRIFRSATELAIIGGDAYVMSLWETSPSELMSQDSEANPDGDIRSVELGPSEVIRDPSKQKFEDSDWIIAREWVSRFEVAAKWAPENSQAVDGNDPSQELRESILGQRMKLEYDRTRMTLMNWMFNSNLYGQSDDIAVYRFFHKRSATMPNGRLVTFLEDGTVLQDTELPTRTITVRRISPSDMNGSPFGYTPMFDLLNLQEAIDALYSAVATNQLTFGVQLIMAMKGSDIDFRQLARGLSFIEYANPEGKPEPLNLVHTPSEVFEFISRLEKTMETLSGVNAVVRGDVPENLKSGSSLAIVQAQSISFSSGLQQSYAHLLEDVYTDYLNFLKKYAVNERTVTIIGKYQRPMLESFVGEGISSINRVVVQAGDPSTMTQAGRDNIAETLIKSGLIKKPEEYLAVKKTGTLEPLFEGEQAELMLVRGENEAMASGQAVHAVPTDEHALHIKEHRCVLASPEARSNPELLNVVSDHLAEHVTFLADPSFAALLMVLGQTPLGAAMMPEPGQGYASGPGPNNKQPGDSAKPKEEAGPKMPVNPQTGNRWDPESGGGVTGKPPEVPENGPSGSR